MSTAFTRRRSERSPFRPRLEHLESRLCLSCTAVQDSETLFIRGDEGDNAVEIVGAERGVQITCDGHTELFEGVRAVNAQLAGGNDRFAIDNRNGLLGGIHFHVLGQGGDDGFLLGIDPGVDDLGLAPAANAYEGGEGTDSLQVVTGARADLLDIGPGVRDNSVHIGVIDIATGSPTASLNVVGTEDITLKAGDGDDQFNVTGPLAAAVHLFGQGGGDATSIHYFDALEGSENLEPVLLDGGTGNDTAVIVGTDAPELIEILGRDNSVHIGVTDIATGSRTASLNVVDTEDVTVKAGENDDRFSVHGPISASLHLFGELGADVLGVASVSLEAYPAFSYDSGTDKVGGVATITLDPREQLIEILGVERDVPDPLIRVTDLATGRVTAELMIVNTPSIIVDSAGGNDRVVMNDDGGPLTGIDFSILTGGGDDEVAIEINAAFAAPPEPDGPEPRIGVALDTGAGNDRVSAQVAIADLSFELAARLGAGNDRFSATYQAPPEPDMPEDSIGTRQLDPGNKDSLQVFGQDGADLFDLALGGPDTVDDPDDFNGALSVLFDGGAGNDLARLRQTDIDINGPFDIALNMGAGEDEVALFMEPCIFDSYQLRVDLGAGNDRLTANLQAPQDPDVPADRVGELGITVLGREGNDSLNVVVGNRNDASEPELHLALAITFDGGGGNDNAQVSLGRIAIVAPLSIHLGGGNGSDFLAVDMLEPCIRPEGRLDILLEGGNGADRLAARGTLDEDTAGPTRIVALGGNGDDLFDIAYDPNDVNVTALVDGGRGYDKARVTAGVEVRNCEEVETAQGRRPFFSRWVKVGRFVKS